MIFKNLKADNFYLPSETIFTCENAQFDPGPGSGPRNLDPDKTSDKNLIRLQRKTVSDTRKEKKLDPDPTKNQLNLVFQPCCKSQYIKDITTVLKIWSINIERSEQIFRWILNLDARTKTGSDSAPATIPNSFFLNSGSTTLV